MPCSQCGACCRGLFIYNATSPEDVFSRDHDPSIQFIREYWKLISVQLGVERAPMAESYKDDVVFLECDQFNWETNQCKCYEHRPHICSVYPFYKGLLRKAETLPPTCGYREECSA